MAAQEEVAALERHDLLFLRFQMAGLTYLVERVLHFVPLRLIAEDPGADLLERALVDAGHVLAVDPDEVPVRRALSDEALDCALARVVVLLRKELPRLGNHKNRVPSGTEDFVRDALDNQCLRLWAERFEVHDVDPRMDDEDVREVPALDLRDQVLQVVLESRVDFLLDGAQLPGELLIHACLDIHQRDRPFAERHERPFFEEQLLFRVRLDEALDELVVAAITEERVDFGAVGEALLSRLRLEHNCLPTAAIHERFERRGFPAELRDTRHDQVGWLYRDYVARDNFISQLDFIDHIFTFLLAPVGGSDC